MLHGVIAEARAELDAAVRRVGAAVAIGVLALAGLGFAAAALWTVAASAWGAAGASLLLSGLSFAAAVSAWLIWSIVARRGAQAAEDALARSPARAEALLSAFRAGAEIGGRLARR